jgi:hypothetical protein
MSSQKNTGIRGAVRGYVEKSSFKKSTCFGVVPLCNRFKSKLEFEGGFAVSWENEVLESTLSQSSPKARVNLPTVDLGRKGKTTSRSPLSDWSLNLSLGRGLDLRKGAAYFKQLLSLGFTRRGKGGL